MNSVPYSITLDTSRPVAHPPTWNGVLKAYQDEINVMDSWMDFSQALETLTPINYFTQRLMFFSLEHPVISSLKNNQFHFPTTAADEQYVFGASTWETRPNSETFAICTHYGLSDETLQFLRGSRVTPYVAEILGHGDHGLLHNLNLRLSVASIDDKTMYVDPRVQKHFTPGVVAHEFLTAHMWYLVRQEQMKRENGLRTEKQDQLHEIIEELQRAHLRNPAYLATLLIAQYEKVMGLEDPVGLEVKSKFGIPVDSFNESALRENLIISCLNPFGLRSHFSDSILRQYINVWGFFVPKNAKTPISYYKELCRHELAAK